MCPPDSKIQYSVFYVYLCSCIIILCVSFTCLKKIKKLCSCKANFYVIQNNKDSVF